MWGYIHIVLHRCVGVAPGTGAAFNLVQARRAVGQSARSALHPPPCVAAQPCELQQRTSRPPPPQGVADPRYASLQGLEAIWVPEKFRVTLGSERNVSHSVNSL